LDIGYIWGINRIELRRKSKLICFSINSDVEQQKNMREFIRIFFVVSFLLILTSMFSNREGLVGKYFNKGKNRYVTLTVKLDSTYTQKWSSSGIRLKAKGKWSVYSDTLILKPLILKVKKGKKDVINILVNQKVDRYLIREDTLRTLYKRKEGYKKWFSLTRVL